MSEIKRVWMDSDEWYPVYSIRDDGRFGVEVEATAEQVERWARALAEFERAQDEMGELYDVAETARRERVAQEKAEREAREREERKQQQARLRAEQKKRERGWQRLREAGGYAYDADGNVIGVLKPATSPMDSDRVQIRPVEE